MKYRSDYLGRMEEIEYPDGEVVKYGYDEGGQIRSAIGERVGKEFVYVKEIGYDQYGQRIYIEYGNNDTNAQGNPMGGGVKTWYTYDEERRLLKNILSEKEGKIYQDIHYDFDKVGNINGYENNAGRYSTRQEYTYDSLYQLIEAKGTSRQLEYEAGNLEAYKADYIQSFGFDRIGNMTSKVSRESKTNLVRNGMDLNYDFEYTYYKSKEGHKTHKAEQIGNMYYKYDANGNVIEERAGGHRAGDISSIPYYYNNGVYSTEYGFGLSKPGTGKDETAYERVFTWDYRNQLIQSKDNRYTVHYRYGADGQRALKYTEGTRNETLYFNNMWQVSSTNEEERWLQSKHIFVGETRIATKSNYQERDGSTNNNYGFEQVHQYWYHGDHLGSAQLITNHLGVLHERIEYTPYGEVWIELKYNSDEASLPYRFTGKELDEETNLYYYGARYLDPRTSRWISGDPAMGEYIPGAPINDEVRKQNQNLPGGGGIYNIVNLHVFHYAGNNPIKYIDPDGRSGEPSANARMLASGNAAHINRLHPSIRDAVSKLISTLATQGINVGIYASMRTVEGQNAEYRRGRNENGSDILGEVRTTWVQGGYSYHNYGLAIDIEVYTDIDNSWAKDWDAEGPTWQTVITTAESLGFTAGYRWKGDQQDPPHFQIEQGKTTAELKALYDAGTMKDGFVILQE
ncbi:hypothetical protein FACS189447_08290 [Spirochaetia bacterium]|nr:hypothetical protein FACS189447_08290 [Spirochaetia bacterium]